MGNVSGAGIISRRRQSSRRTHPPPPPPQLPHPEIASNRYVYPGGVVPYNVQYPNPNPNFNPPPPGFYQYPPGYYPPPPPAHPPAMPVPLQVPYDHHHPHGPPPLHIDPAHANWPGGRYPCGPMMTAPTPYVEHQKAMTIRNDVNLKKETLKVEMDENDPGKHLVTFTFDATVAGSITLIFFAKEIENCQLKPLKESSLPPVEVEFQAGLGQKFVQPTGTGIDLSMFEESELLKEGEMDVYPLVVKAETLPLPLPQPAPVGTESEPDAKLIGENVVNAQITQAVFEKERGKFQVKVIKQILWVNSTRYELQEIYGIGNSVEHESGGGDSNDAGKECVICLSEPRDTTVLPCRHMCMCSGCAKVLRFQTNRCPICRQPVERLLEIKVCNNETDEG